ncbi:MAG: hypothetical protein K0R55_2072 [Sporomusa sp.]|nr:hypothetical protein [Sporomusa sp.]
MHTSTLALPNSELGQYDIIERNRKQLRMWRIKRVSKPNVLPQTNDIEINDFRPDQITGITYDKSIALVRINCPANGCNDKWITEVFQALGEFGVTFDMVSIQPRQISFTVDNRLIDRVNNCFVKFECYPEIVAECVRFSVQRGGGQPLLNTITVVAETMAQINIPLLRLAESYGLIEALIESRYINEAQKNLEKRFRMHVAPSGPGISKT